MTTTRQRSATVTPSQLRKKSEGGAAKERERGWVQAGRERVWTHKGGKENGETETCMVRPRTYVTRRRWEVGRAKDFYGVGGKRVGRSPATYADRGDAARGWCGHLWCGSRDGAASEVHESRGCEESEG